MTHAIRTGTTDQIAYFRAYDTDGTAKVNLTSATAGLSLSVFRVGASAVSISSLSDKAADNTAHADGAIRRVQGNLYTIDLPDAAIATQVPSIRVKGTYTGGEIEGEPHPIVGYDGTAVRVGASDGTGVTLAADQAVNVTKVNGTSQTAGDLAALLATLSSYVDTEVAAIKAKTDNLPADPADASDIAAAFGTVNSTLVTIAGYIDTEVAAIKAKTDNLPADPADASDIAAAIAAIPTSAAIADAVWDEEMAGHTTAGTYGGRIVRASNSNVTVQITGSNHISADVHAFQTDVIDASAFASSAVTEIQSGLATAAELAKVPKSGETRRYTQVAANEGNKTADVSIGVPL